MTRRVLVQLGLLACLVALTTAALALGQVRLAPGEVVDALRGHGTPMARLVVLQLRLPRTLAALLAGALLAVAGMLLQAVTRNPLAEASTVGITPAAVAAVATLAVCWPQAPAAAVGPVAATGALLAALALMAVQRLVGAGQDTIVIAGLALGVACQAVTSLCLVLAPGAAQATLVWLAGSTQATGDALARALVLPTLVALAVAVLLGRPLDLLWCDDALTLGRGFAPAPWRAACCALAASLVAGAVLLAGALGFVGLVAPLLARRMTGSTQHRQLVLPTALAGATTTVAADLAGRLLLGVELPAGVMTALLGGPVFLAVLRHRPRGSRRSVLRGRG